MVKWPWDPFLQEADVGPAVPIQFLKGNFQIILKQPAKAVPVR